MWDEASFGVRPKLLSIQSRKGMSSISLFSSFFQKKAKPRQGWKLLGLGLGAAALWALSALGPFQPTSPALEASVFNGGGSFPQESGADTSQTLTAEEARVVPLGTAFGIKLFTDGVIVVSLSQISTGEGPRCPAEEAGLRPGDYLLEADGMAIQNNTALAAYIGRSQGQPIRFTVRRGDQVSEAQVTPVYGDGAFQAGMWVRDSAAGIGTLTFYDRESQVFAGLGHGICDRDTSAVMALKSGEPAPITLCGIEKSQPGQPGQLQGYFSSEDALGELLGNNDTGVYGTLDQAPQGEEVSLLPREQVAPGPCEILVSLDDAGPQWYQGEITQILTTGERTKNFLVTVTDERLLAKTGGIVQGMSGCPILQQGKLAGAVTHDSEIARTTGYGIFAQTMWEEAQKAAAAK